MLSVFEDCLLGYMSKRKHGLVCCFEMRDLGRMIAVLSSQGDGGEEEKHA